MLLTCCLCQHVTIVRSDSLSKFVLSVSEHLDIYTDRLTLSDTATRKRPTVYPAETRTHKLFTSVSKVQKLHSTWSPIRLLAWRVIYFLYYVPVISAPIMLYQVYHRVPLLY